MSHMLILVNKKYSSYTWTPETWIPETWAPETWIPETEVPARARMLPPATKGSLGASLLSRITVCIFK